MRGREMSEPDKLLGMALFLASIALVFAGWGLSAFNAAGRPPSIGTICLVAAYMAAVVGLCVLLEGEGDGK